MLVNKASIWLLFHMTFKPLCREINRTSKYSYSSILNSNKTFFIVDEGKILVSKTYVNVHASGLNLDQYDL